MMIQQRREFVQPRHMAVHREFVQPRHMAVHREFVQPRHMAVRHQFVQPRHMAVRREFAQPRHMAVRRTMMPEGVRFARRAHIANVRTRFIGTRLVGSRETFRRIRFAHTHRRIQYVAGRVVAVRNNVVYLQRPMGGEVPVSVRYVPSYRTIAPGSVVTLPVTFNDGTYFAYLPRIVPTVTSALLPVVASLYAPYTTPFYGYTSNPQAYYDPNFYGDGAVPVAFNNVPTVPDCTQPYYGYNFNQYYFTKQQYYDYCGYSSPAYYTTAYSDGYYSPNLASYGTVDGYNGYNGYNAYGGYGPYVSPANSALVSGIIVGKSGSNLIVLTDNMQPAIVNVGEAQAFGNTSGPLDVGRPIVAAGFYDPTNTLVATAVQ